MDGEAAAFAVWLAFAGAAGGSFVSAVADRTCAGRDWVRSRSACAACGAAIGARDLVPVLSFLWLRGRCRACAAAIPARLFWGEAAGLAAACIALSLEHRAADRIAATAFLVLLVGLFQSDRLCLRLPDALTAPLGLAGLWIGIRAHGPEAALLAALAGSGALWLIGRAYRGARGREGLGFGDVKMMVGLGAAMGPFALPWLTLVASLSALATVAARAAMRGAMPARDMAVAFGCHLAVGAGIVWTAERLGSG